MKLQNFPMCSGGTSEPRTVGDRPCRVLGKTVAAFLVLASFAGKSVEASPTYAVSNLAEGGLPVFSLVGAGHAAAFTTGESTKLGAITLRLSAGVVGNIHRGSPTGAVWSGNIPAKVGSNPVSFNLIVAQLYAGLTGHISDSLPLVAQAAAQINGSQGSPGSSIKAIINQLEVDITGHYNDQRSLVDQAVGQLMAAYPGETFTYQDLGLTVDGQTPDQASYVALLGQLLALDDTVFDDIDESAAYEIALYDNAGGTPGSQLAYLALVTDSAGILGDFVVDDSMSTLLLAGTTYWVKVTLAGGDFATWVGTTSTDQASGLPGWSIATGGMHTAQFGVNGVPELDPAGMPLAAGLLAAVLELVRQRKNSSR